MGMRETTLLRRRWNAATLWRRACELRRRSAEILVVVRVTPRISTKNGGGEMSERVVRDVIKQECFWYEYT